MTSAVEGSRRRNVSTAAALAAIVGPAIFVQQLLRTQQTSLAPYVAACWFAVSCGGLATVTTAWTLERSGRVWPERPRLRDRARLLAVVLFGLSAGVAVSLDVRRVHAATPLAVGFVVVSIAISIAAGLATARSVAEPDCESLP